MPSSSHMQRDWQFQRERTVTDELQIALWIVLAVIVYVVANVWRYARKSKEQWQAVDKSKLKVWDDDNGS
jgi:hypothetical protein